MDINITLSVARLRALQTRADFVVHRARRNDEPWAAGAPEFDVVVALRQTVEGGRTIRGRALGKYMCLGAGRGYLSLKDGTQWRIGGGEASLVQPSRDPHYLSTVNPAFVATRPVDIYKVDDPGAVAYITRILEEL